MHIYLKLLLRGLRKRKLTTIISLLGLSIGLTLIMFIVVFLKKELSAEKFHEKAANIYRVESEYKTKTYPLTAAPMYKWLTDNFGEVKQSARVFSPYYKSFYSVKLNEQSFEVENPVFVDPEFFDIFSFPVKYGRITDDFDTKNAIVLTESLAQKLFGNENPVGKTITYCDKNKLTVMAVLKTLPSNSSMHFDLLLPFASFNDYNTFDLESWGRLTYQTFIVSDGNPQMLESQINQKIKEQFPEKEFSYFLSSLKDIHFIENAQYDNVFRHESKTSLRLFLIVAIAILLIATINFLNLTVASSSLRAKENKIRQIEGANRFHISLQYISEAVFISLLAAILAIGFIELLFPTFNHLLDAPLSRMLIHQPWFYGCLAAIGIVTGVLSGIYPALKFSQVQYSSLNNKSANATSARWNNLLVVFQFATSIMLIIATLFITKQTNFLQNIPLGFNKEQVLYLRLNDNLVHQQQVILNKLENTPGVVAAASCDFVPGQNYSQQIRTINNNGVDKSLTVFHTKVSQHYLKTLDIQLLNGRNFYENEKTNQSNIIVNEAFVKAFDLKNPLETVVEGEKIIGIVNDFNFNSLHQAVGPMIIRLRDDSQTSMMVRVDISKNNIASVVPTIKGQITEVVPNTFAEVKFLNDKINQQYEKETKTRKLLSYFSFFAIFISAMGLFGLVVFTTNRRIKEIGIRKVNGAKISEVMTMLNRDFIKWVAIAFVIATPIAYYAMHKWLENFAYKTTLSWWIFALAGVLALGIALLTVSWQSWRAATRNPVEALRYE